MLTIISGGQTGVDRAALDAAFAVGCPYCGWCPKGGWAEDSPDPPGVRARYPGLLETPEPGPEQRTEWNVRDADSVLILVGAGGVGASKGTAVTLAHAKERGKPLSVIDFDDPNARAQMQTFIRARAGETMCIAGPRESEAPGIYAKVFKLLSCLLDEGLERTP